MDDINDQIDSDQFGNRTSHSTSHYLVKLIDNIVEHADNPKRLSRIVITDLFKAFDRVHHSVATPKLIQMGARPSIIPWISSFLSQDLLSSWLQLPGGVPQGALTGACTLKSTCSLMIRLISTH